MEAVRLLEGERGLMMDWREAVVRVVRRAVVVRRVGVRSFIFFFGGGVVRCLRRRGVLLRGLIESKVLDGLSSEEWYVRLFLYPSQQSTKVSTWH